MRLYHYDHCPYCVKVRMICGLKNVPVEETVLLNDDERTPISLSGKKMLPILIDKAGRPMNESLDIIRYLDHLPEYGPPIVEPSRDDLGFNRWLKEARNYHYFLAMPRWIRMGLPEFATDSAVQYFVSKKTEFMGSFPAKYNDSAKYIALAEGHLAELAENMTESEFFWGPPTIDDFHLFATLRVLTAVKALKFPGPVMAYSERLSQLTKVPLHWSIAL